MSAFRQRAGPSEYNLQYIPSLLQQLVIVLSLVASSSSPPAARAAPSSSPSISPSTSASTCTACVSISVLPISSVEVDPFTMHWWNHEDWRARITNDIRAQAQQLGVKLAPAADGNEHTSSWTNHSVQTCLAFASAADAAQLQPWIAGQVRVWLDWFVGSCCAYWLPYTFKVAVHSHTSSNGTGCLRAETAPYKCDMVRPPPTFPGGCKCDRSKGTTPFAVQPATYILPGRTDDTLSYCFIVASIIPTDPKSRCGSSTSLRKAEIWADDSQRRAVKGIGTSQPWEGDYGSDWRYGPPGWGRRGDNTLKVASGLLLDWGLDRAAQNPMVCLEVARAAHLRELCMTGEDLCWRFTRLFADACSSSGAARGARRAFRRVPEDSW